LNILARNNVKISGSGTTPLLFAHGFGCDQQMWRYVTPAFEETHRIILFDHVGAGNSDLASYDETKYKDLEGYADDILEIIHALELKDVILVGHSVSAIIGIIAAIRQPALFRALVLVAPSPSYINDKDYHGGFEREEIDQLLESLDNNHLGWSMSMAPVIMGNADRKELAEELANSFCRTDPDIAKHFARTTFLSDRRELLNQCEVPSLILQCSDDVIAPATVGDYMQQHLKNSTLVRMKATGHCPNLSAPEETIRAIKEYLEHA
jgi:sigma-B regulation protein RsbQ